jgi:hypothetical protein
MRVKALCRLMPFSSWISRPFPNLALGAGDSQLTLQTTSSPYPHLVRGLPSRDHQRAVLSLLLILYPYVQSDSCQIS